MKPRVLIAALLCAMLLAACGGGSDSSTSDDTTPEPNTLPVIIDQGPQALVDSGTISSNVLYASVTLCTPGSATACQTIDHVQVDTGSTGLRIMSSALNGSVVPTAARDATSGLPLLECTQFADGYIWGSVVVADVKIGGRPLPSLTLHLIGATAAGAAPPGCVSGPDEGNVVAFGANGVLGVGNFLQDCGPACAASAVAGFYYTCPSTDTASCAPAIVASASQVANPVGVLDSDYNGVVIELPSVASPGSASVSGTLYFGIDTEDDNSLGTAQLLTLDDQGTLVTSYEGAAQSDSFVDSGSNAYYYNANGIPTCTDYTWFYCPINGSGGPGTIVQSATLTGGNGAFATVSFAVANADQLFLSDSETTFPGLAGPNTDFTGGPLTGFDWGLPFFFGRSVYVLFEANQAGGVQGPAVGF